MPTVLKNPQSINLPLFDPTTKEDCVVEKAVDVSADCFHLDPGIAVRLVFTRVTRGHIVVIQDMEGNKVRMWVHFFVEELDTEMYMPEQDATFESWARKLGLTKERLRILIEENAT